ncbi:hypothetical protein GCM10007385_14930 [Tateyamaria omphalii]|nr:hypothetical protein GCM10007385_14930 [Tateyamaria omphalii]
MTLVREPQRNGTSVLAFGALNKAISNKPIDEPHSSRVRSAKDAAKRIVG